MIPDSNREINAQRETLKNVKLGMERHVVTASALFRKSGDSGRTLLGNAKRAAETRREMLRVACKCITRMRQAQANIRSVRRLRAFIREYRSDPEVIRGRVIRAVETARAQSTTDSSTAKPRKTRKKSQPSKGGDCAYE